MEPKKLNKLTIKKETISLLNDYELSKHKGGTTGFPYGCVSNYCIPCGTYDCTPTGMTTCPCTSQGCLDTWR